METYTTTINATEYPPQTKHKIIFETFESLGLSETLQLINDHDPRPLRFQFEATYPDHFEWEYLEQGPEIFRVKITKL